MALYDQLLKAYADNYGVTVDEYLATVHSQRNINGQIVSFDPSQYHLPSDESDNEIRLIQERMFRILNDELYKSAGYGGFYNQLQTNLACLNRYGPAPFVPNRAFSGYTFITRPQLNLSSTNIRNNRILSILETDEPNDVNLMIRGLLDPRWYLNWATTGTPKQSGLLDTRNPWMTPLCNNLLSISGFPDFNIDPEKGKQGFFNESLTTVAGSDRLKRGCDLSLTFKEIHGGVLLTLFHMWLEYMAAVVKNELTAYAQEIDQRRLNYTVSIYRFITTPDKQYIQHCAKATGCFPMSVPFGGLFNVSQGELYIKNAAEFTIPFTANVIEYNDPIIPVEFNILAKRYWPEIESAVSTPTFEIDPHNSKNLKYSVPSENMFSKYLRFNYVGLPYIEAVPYKGLRLVYKYMPDNPNETLDYGPFEEVLDSLVAAKQKKLENKNASKKDMYTEYERLLNNPFSSGVYI
jgi:hypothetical protein